ncbi:MAG TPA: 30S ribosomal protein S16 [Alphaproteobacteria bacterium]|jgi:small subunit ribosomal protein S16
MALKIRLSRGGAKKRPFYRIVVADSRKPRDGRFIERLGHYDPMLARDDPKRVIVNEERARHWLGAGASPSHRVALFLAQAGIVDKPAIAEQTRKNRPRAKAQERLKAAAEAAEAAKTAAAEAAAQPAPAAEEPKAAETPEEAPAAESAGETPAEETSSEEEPAEDAKAAAAPAEEASPAGDAAEDGEDDKAKAG